MLRINVVGMDCQHCVHAIREAVAEVAPHANTSVDLAAGTADISGPADAASVIAAIKAAGYEATAA